MSSTNECDTTELFWGGLRSGWEVELGWVTSDGVVLRRWWGKTQDWMESDSAYGLLRSNPLRQTCDREFSLFTTPGLKNEEKSCQPRLLKNRCNGVCQEYFQGNRRCYHELSNIIIIIIIINKRINKIVQEKWF